MGTCLSNVTPDITNSPSSSVTDKLQKSSLSPKNNYKGKKTRRVKVVANKINSEFVAKQIDIYPRVSAKAGTKKYSSGKSQIPMNAPCKIKSLPKINCGKFSLGGKFLRQHVTSSELLRKTSPTRTVSLSNVKTEINNQDEADNFDMAIPSAFG